MRLGIDGVGNHAGGGKHVLFRVLNCALKSTAQHITLWCSNQSDLLSQLPTHKKLTTVPIECDLTTRLNWYYNDLQNQVTQHKIDRVLCLNAMGTLNVPHINFIQQPLLFSALGLSTMPWHFIPRMAMIRAMTTASCQHAKRVVVQTPSMAKNVIHGLGVLPQNICTLMPDIPKPKHTMAQGRQNHLAVLYVGHMAPYKNLEVVFKAMSMIEKTQPTAKLTITTHAQYKTNPKWLNAIGPQPPEVIYQLMANADVLVMPSLAETVGLPMLEAMTMGCPIVAADLPYAHDVCGQAAHFFDPKTPDALAQAILFVAKKENATTLIQRGLSRTQSLRQTHPYDALIKCVMEHD